ncbi:MAG: aldehyde dehydrogenase family protein, partial [Mesorhizobium sp.]
GQACVAGTRLIVEKSVADRMTTAILVKMKAVWPGPTWDEATHYSPIISERQRGRVDSIVQAAVKAGGECLTGGAAMDSPGYFYEPTLIADVDQVNPAIVEEIFGPVLTVQTFETEDEALALSSHPTYGLASGLFTSDLSRTIRLARKLEAGTVWVNRYSRSRDHILPTGGYKRSGIGKDLGRDAYLANRRTKSVLVSL